MGAGPESAVIARERRERMKQDLRCLDLLLHFAER